MLMTILAVVLVFGGLIFFHELGHFSVARAFGMRVKPYITHIFKNPNGGKRTLWHVLPV